MQIEIENLPEEQNIQSPQGAARSDPVVHLAIAERFGVTNANKEEHDKLAEIWALAKSKAGTDNIQDIIWEVIHLEGVLGAPRLGETRLDKLYKYARLKRQEAHIQSELKGVAGVQTLPHLRVR